MMLDLIFLIVLAYFVLKGYNRGAIMSLFTSFACILGFIVASKCSGTVANLLFANEAESSLSRLLPLVAYVIVFFIVVFLVKLVAKLSKKVVKKVSLSGLDKLLGGLIYLFLVVIGASVFYWFMNQLHVLSPNTIYSSKSFQLLEPLAPSVFDKVGLIIPFVKSSFEELQQYFELLNTKLDTYVGLDR